MMDLRETTWSRGSHRLWGRHRHYLLAHLLRNNHTTIQVNGASAITMMTSLLIHLSNHSPQLSSVIFQVGSTTKEEKKTINKEKARGKDR
jgi:hypothetical protein